MLVLDNGDKLRGDASAATVVDFTLHGLASGTTLSQLADGQLAISEGDLYASPGDQTVVTTITLTNTDTSDRTINLYLQPSAGTSRRLIPKDLSLAAGYTLTCTGDYIQVLNTTGNVLTSGNVGAASTVSGPSGPSGPTGADSTVSGPSGPTGADSTVSGPTGPSGPSGPTGPIDISGTPVANDYSQFTDADTVRGREYAEVLADIFSVALPENTSIQLDPALSADTKWTGITEDGTAGTTGLVYGYCYYLASTGKWELAKADVVGTSINKVGMCVGAAATDATGKLLLYGKIRADDEFPAFTVGAPVFISAATVGLLTSTAPTGTTDFVVRIVGQADTADVVFFKPDNAYATLV